MLDPAFVLRFPKCRKDLRTPEKPCKVTLILPFLNSNLRRRSAITRFILVLKLGDAYILKLTMNCEGSIGWNQFPKIPIDMKRHDDYY